MTTEEKQALTKLLETMNNNMELFQHRLEEVEKSLIITRKRIEKIELIIKNNGLDK